MKTLMSLSLVATLGAAMVVSTTGCASKKKTAKGSGGVPLSGTVTDISPAALAGRLRRRRSRRSSRRPPR